MARYELLPGEVLALMRFHMGSLIVYSDLWAELNSIIACTIESIFLFKNTFRISTFVEISPFSVVHHFNEDSMA